jgi:P27 family predicted phage terminase small subunit
MPGPPPKPTAIKLLEGNPGKQKLQREPEMSRGSIHKREAWFGKHGKHMWDNIVPRLRKEVKLATVDENLAIQMCAAYGAAMEARENLHRHGTVTKEGKLSVWHRVWKENATIFHQCAAKFGMSPADRARIFTDLLASDGSVIEDDDDNLLNGNWQPKPPQITYTATEDVN